MKTLIASAEHTAEERELGAIIWAFDDQFFTQIVQEPKRFVNDEVVSCPREGERRKAFRLLSDRGLKGLLEEMEDPLAAYVETRMTMRIEDGTFTTMEKEKDRAL